MSLGKLDPEELGASVLPYKGWDDPRVQLWPRLGGDGGVVELEDTILSMSSDPITGASRLIGRLSVVVNANDIAALGGEPEWMLMTLLVPESWEGDSIGKVMESAHRKAKELQIAIVGGHTEKVEGLKGPILCGSIIGLNERFLDPSSVSSGDRLVIIGTAGLEGTAILADTFRDKLENSGVSAETIEEATDLYEDLCVLGQARSVRDHTLLMHDPTEGGVMGGIGELSKLIEAGIKVSREKIPVASLTEEICGALGVDPLRLISSGALLAIVKKEELPLIKKDLGGFEVEQIGEVTPDEGFCEVGQDELWRVLEDRDG